MITVTGDPIIPDHSEMHNTMRIAKDALTKSIWPKITVEKRASTWAEIVELYRTSNNLENSEEFKAQFLHKDLK